MIKLTGKTLIFSDLHIGSPQSELVLKSFIDFLKKENPDNIVFCGDVLDVVSNPNIECVPYLVNFLMHGKNIYWIEGNHDNGMLYHTIVFNYNDIKILARHGHEFDSCFTKMTDKFFVRLNDWFMNLTGFNWQCFLRRILEKRYPEGLFVPKLYKQRNKIIKFHQNHNIDVLISGHTHYPELSKQGTLIYANPGRFGTYLALDSNKLELRRMRYDSNKMFLQTNKIRCYDFSTANWTDTCSLD